MSRLLLSSVLVALVAGLTLLACIPDPVEEEWLGKVGDEFRITDDAVEQHDPVFYNTENYNSIEEAQVAYHNGSSIYLYDIASKTTETLYQAPSGYTITTMCAIKTGGWSLGDLVIALSNTAECIVLRESDGTFTEIFNDTGSMIDNIAIYKLQNGTLSMNLERGGEIFVFEDGILWDSFVGVEPSFDTESICYYIGSYNGYDCIYIYHVGNYWFVYSDGSDLHCPIVVEDDILQTETFLTSDKDGDVDIYKLFPNNDEVSQVCNMDGVENELSGWYKYVLFTRTVDGQTDVFIIRGDY